ncbi:hypothetical protein P0136_12860 [Lentisphaerota bacterium ZTH]|nr:hypothetical protein JYG24_09625 [Lentisphaerota bacterium]WET06248.1 hypothetical protein P0136_12860 [Lentisphaerota bacterium ZTH]
MAGHGVTWGISLAHWDNLITLPNDVPKCFNTVELSAALVDSLTGPAFRQGLRRYQNVYLRDLLDPAVSREVLDHSKQIVSEFKNHFNRLVTRAGDCQVSGVSADFDLERALQDKDYASDLLNILRIFAGTAYSADCDLLLPLRVPFLPGKFKTEDYLTFVTAAMIPKLGFSLDIHPHETAGKELPCEEICRWLGFDISVMRFIYEPETGNKLVPKLIEPWIQTLKKLRPGIKIVFVPVCKDPDVIKNEIKTLPDLISSLKIG